MKDVTAVIVTIVGVGVALGVAMAYNANGIRSDIRQVDSKIEELRADFREDVAALRAEIGNERRVQQARLDAFGESRLAITERQSNIEGRLLQQPVIVDVPRDSESDSTS